MEFGQKHYVSQMDPAKRETAQAVKTQRCISAKGRIEGQKEIPCAVLEFSSHEARPGSAVFLVTGPPQ